MELQLVSKETALLAKELGFNEICYNIFIRDLNNDSAVRKISMVGMRNEEVQLESLICTIPYQEFLAKWLREKFNIVVYVLPEEDEELRQILYSCKVTTYMIGRQINDYDTGSLYGIYEEALEDGLLHTLNHIKDLKLHLI